MGIAFHINTTMTPQHIKTLHNTTPFSSMQISKGCYLNKQNIFLEVYILGHAS
jgi:hypothetical protein